MTSLCRNLLSCLQRIDPGGGYYLAARWPQVVIVWWQHHVHGISKTISGLSQSRIQLLQQVSVPLLLAAQQVPLTWVQRLLFFKENINENIPGSSQWWWHASSGDENLRKQRRKESSPLLVIVTTDVGVLFSMQCPIWYRECKILTRFGQFRQFCCKFTQIFVYFLQT